MPPELTVAICSHNPRAHYLQRTLQGLSAQTLPSSRWELLLIDNASLAPLSSAFDLSWHPLSRHIREDRLGLTAARLRAIDEAAGSVLVFVDDDNILQPDYLENATRLGLEFPFLGTWGAGIVLGEFEVPPESWTRDILEWLCVREIKADCWSNLPLTTWTVPYGAGLCVRLKIAQQYAEICRTEPLRVALDRRGKSLNSMGDLDLAYTACAMGMGMGLFRSLSLTHLIPAIRLTEKYLLRLREGMAFSWTVLEYLHGKPLPDLRVTPMNRARLALQQLFMPNRQRRFQQADRRGVHRAVRHVRKTNASSNGTKR